MNLAASHLHKTTVAFLFWCLLVNVPVSSLASSYCSDHDGAATVESAAKFIHERSGMILSTEVKKRLAAIEQQTLDGARQRIATQDLALILTDILLERLNTVTDHEIQQAAKTFRHDPDPQYDYILLSWDGKHMSTRREFVAAVKSFREKSRVGDPKFRALVKKFVEGSNNGEGLNGRVKNYSTTLPQFASAIDDRLTPLQAVLVTYSLASDDNLSASTSGLRAEMAREHQTIGGPRYPDPEGRFPFGAQGYLFPMPTDLIFSDSTLGNLVDRIEKKTRAS